MLCHRLRSLISRSANQRIQVFGNVRDFGGGFQENSLQKKREVKVEKREGSLPLDLRRFTSLH